MLSLSEFLRRLDEESDDDFDGYIDEEEAEDNDGEGCLDRQNNDGEVCLEWQNNDGEACLDRQNNDGEICLDRQNNDVCIESLVGDVEGIPEFQGSAGCTRDTTNMTPYDFFTMLVEDSMLEEIVKQTNLFAEQFLEGENIPPNSRTHFWGDKQLDVDELKKFVVIVIIMGIIHYPHIEDYWATRWPFGTDAYRSIMKRDRFFLLLRFLHLNDSRKYIPKGQVGHDA